MFTDTQIQTAIKLYQDDKLPLWKVAEILNVKYNDIRKALKKLIRIRKTGETFRVTNEIDDENIKNDYINGLSIRKLSLKYNVDRTVIQRVLRQKQVILRDIKESNRKKSFDEISMIKLYESGSTCMQLALEFKTSTLTITRILRKYNIIIRKSKKSKGNITLRKFSPEIEQVIINKYVIDDYSCGDLGREFKTSHSVISGILKRNNIPIIEGRIKNQIYEIDETYFEQINSPCKAFLFGFMLTDGHMKHKDKKYAIILQLQAADKAVLDFMKLELKSGHPISYDKNKDAFRLDITNKKLALDIEKLGCISNKTYLLEYPRFLSDDLFHHFLHGCIMGDGSVSFSEKENTNVSLIGTHDLIKNIRTKIINLLPISGVISQHEESLHISRLDFNWIGSCLEICNFIFKDAPFIMLRKFLNFEKMIEKRKLQIQEKRSEKRSRDILAESIRTSEEIRLKLPHLFTV